MRSSIRRAALITVVTVVALALAPPAAVAAPRWRPVERAPIAGRLSAGVVWTGRRVLVWGGVHRGASIDAVGDGAAYDPARDRWRTIAPAPSGVLGDGGRASAWTGRTAVFWAGNSPDGPARGAVYRPATDRWRILPRGPLGPREGYASFWTGDELFIVGGTSGDGLARPVGAAVDPVTRVWLRAPGLNALHGLVASGIVWTGDVAFIGGVVYTRGGDGWTTVPVFASYDPATDTVTEIPIASPDASSFSPVGRIGNTVVGVGDTPTELAAYDPATDTWMTLASAAATADGQESPQSAWLGDRYVVAHGRRRIEVYDADVDRWRVRVTGSSPFTTLSGSAIAWTGRELFVWSGVADRRGNPTPNVGATLRLTRRGRQR
jgi:hypothetical protein